MGLFVLLVLQGQPVAAFKPEGHEEIERQAYAALRADLTGTFAGIPGPAALQQLVDAGFLQNDGTGQPQVLSGYPDLSLERQFFQDQQAYHFMASNQAVLQALQDPALTSTAQQQRKLLAQAYSECARLTYFLYREILYNPKGSRQAGRGAYVLIHILVDSYSREHTERNGQYELETIKGWQLNRISWPTPAGAAADWRRNFLHGVSGPRDDDWRKAGTKIDLSGDGEQARQAVLKFLVLLLEAKNHPDQVESLWLRFVQQHLQPAGLALDQQIGVSHTGPTTPLTLPVLYQVDPLSRVSDENTLTVFDFDRTPGKYGGLVLQQGIRGSRAGSVFYIVHFSASNTSGRTQLHSFWKRLPKSIEASWTGVQHQNREGAWSQGGQLQLLAGTGLAVPLLDQVVLVPRAGIGYTPRGRQVQGIGGLEFARSWGNKAFTPRTALGLEYDSGGIPANWSLYLRVGFNYWNGRVVKVTP